MSRYINVLCFSLLIAAGVTPLLADEASAPDEPTATAGETPDRPSSNGESETGDETRPSYFTSITVTATGTEADAFDVATPVAVVREEEIERCMPESATDLLRDLQGVDVQGVGPNQARPVIRGQRGLRVLFLENGLRMNNARRQTDFGEIPGLVDIGTVEAVEVVRGPASVLYGSDAIGGVLNLVTRKPSRRGGEPHLDGSLALSYGTTAERRSGRIGVNGGTGRLTFALGLSRRKAGDYEAAAGRFGDVTLNGDTPVLDTGLEDDSVTGLLGFRLTDRHEVFLRWNRYRAERTGFGLIEPALLGDEDDFRIRITYPFQDFDRYTLGYTGTALGSRLADSIEVQAYFQNNERQLANDIDINIGPVSPGAPDSTVEADTLNFTDLETFGFRAEVLRLAHPRHLLTYGLEYYRDDSANTDRSVTTTTLRFPGPPFEIVDVATDEVPNAPNAENTSYGVFLQDEVKATERLGITVGARYQTVETVARATPGWSTAGLDFDDDRLVGALGLTYRLRDDLKLIATYGTAFRAPNIIERLFNGLTPEGSGYQLLNPDLRSEESRNIDLGLKYQRRNAYLEAIAFRNDIDDGIIEYFLSEAEIARLPQDIRDVIDGAGAQFVVQERNIDRLRYQGVEIGAGYRMDNGLSLGGNYTHLSGKRRDRTAAPTGNTLSDKLNLFLRYDQPAGRYWLEYRLRYNGDGPSTVDPDEPVPPVGETIPSFIIHTLAGGVRLFERGSLRHEVVLMVDNLTDELYAEFSNAAFFRPQPKRSLIATYRVRF